MAGNAGLNIPKNLTEEDVLKAVVALPELLSACIDIAGDIERDLNVMAIIREREAVKSGLVKEGEFADLENGTE